MAEHPEDMRHWCTLHLWWDEEKLLEEMAAAREELLEEMVDGPEDGPAYPSNLMVQNNRLLNPGAAVRGVDRKRLLETMAEEAGDDNHDLCCGRRTPGRILVDKKVDLIDQDWVGVDRIQDACIRTVDVVVAWRY